MQIHSSSASLPSVDVVRSSTHPYLLSFAGQLVKLNPQKFFCQLFDALNFHVILSLHQFSFIHLLQSSCSTKID